MERIQIIAAGLNWQSQVLLRSTLPCVGEAVFNKAGTDEIIGNLVCYPLPLLRDYFMLCVSL